MGLQVSVEMFSLVEVKRGSGRVEGQSVQERVLQSLGGGNFCGHEVLTIRSFFLLFTQICSGYIFKNYQK
jgi:hypothetical protein